MQESEIKKIIECLLLCADRPLTTLELTKILSQEHEIKTAVVAQLLKYLQLDWQDKGLELLEQSNGWRFQSKLSLQKYIQHLNPEKPPKYSRAVLETLAIIAWRQPVTRGDIEEIRGVTVSTNIIRLLEERFWIERVGYRDGPGKPALFATTKQFLNDLNLKTLEELPALEFNDDVLILNNNELATLLNNQEQNSQQTESKNTQE